MSDLTEAEVACPACGATMNRVVFDSLNASRLPHHVEAIAKNVFEETACDACGATFQPEHRMLLSHLGLGEWIVMRPWAEHPQYLQHEIEIDHVFSKAFDGAPPAVASQVQGRRPRLVFGQAMLAEAVRLVGLGIPQAAMECVKLLWTRRNMTDVLRFGPAVLCMELALVGGFRFGVRALDDGRRIGEVQVANALLDEVRAQPAEFEAMAPRLFDRPYVSAVRYLY